MRERLEGENWRMERVGQLWVSSRRLDGPLLLFFQLTPYGVGIDWS